jgi:anti-sigma regulatory factor (Ser/Thr protein kinase)
MTVSDREGRDVMILGQPRRAQGADADDRHAGEPRRGRGDRALERERLLARVRTDIIPGLEELVHPTASPADLLALADRQSRDLRAELERTDGGDALFGLTGVDDPACAEERAWVRGHLHDTALQILEFIAGDGFGTGLSAAQIARLAGGAARDLHRWVELVDAPVEAQLLPELELITEQARSLDPRVELVIGDVGVPPTSDQVEALAGAVREALTNARKHANATHVVVRVDCDSDGHTTVTITDDGAGIDLDQAKNGNGLGVKYSIVGRMKRAGGYASLEDAPGGGTIVTLVTSRQGA